MRLVHGLHFNNLRGDLYGGLVAAVVALPLALAFGVASGLGAIAGLYGAIFVGFLQHSSEAPRSSFRSYRPHVRGDGWNRHNFHGQSWSGSDGCYSWRGLSNPVGTFQGGTIYRVGPVSGRFRVHEWHRLYHSHFPIGSPGRPCGKP